ncbi:DUF6415 family natural product biosynthesis protein [Streptomyces sp. Z423-1]|uniref:DUF6415 family natural product biosynthesis protein n=1 Tax=unclassified Streptomyces TaxID=2593676 RepID=UPI0014895119|nr:DUF6415 family natural product biosynthesis protein [Streptomyces sp. Z423-1]
MRSDPLLPVDADTIRKTYDSVLWAPYLPTGEALDTLIGQLQGHVQLLVPEVQALAARMEGETRDTAVHVLVRTSKVLAEGVSPADDAYALAVLARALLALHQHPGPLGEPADGELRA